MAVEAVMQGVAVLSGGYWFAKHKGNYPEAAMYVNVCLRKTTIITSSSIDKIVE